MLVQPEDGALSKPFHLGHFVGREAELARLHDIFHISSQGERQIVFVSGEAGIGKTTLVDTFGDQLTSYGESWGESWVGRGQYVEQYGAGEAYLPILDALGRICRGREGAHFTALLNQYAPSWLAQMPALLSSHEGDQLQQRLLSVTQHRMLRELAEAFEVLSAKRPLVLVLEDLQWSDYATLDCLSFLAPRRERARLMIIGTFRTEDVRGNGHPLQAIQQELQAHRHCVELPLPGLSEAAVGTYLANRLAGQVRLSARKLEQLMYQRTEGNPLFLAHMVDQLLVQNGTRRQTENEMSLYGREQIEEVEQVELDIPESVHQLIEKQATQLSAEHQRLLEVASGVGIVFSVASVAVGLERSLEQIEVGCRQLARRTQFLRVSGEEVWPDGTVAGRYEFIHAIYREVFYARLSPSFRRQLHQHIGERLERGYGAQVRDHAAELAAHFERGREYHRAVQYFDQAAQNASVRYAYRDASEYLKKALQWLPLLPDTPERDCQEVALQTRLGIALEVTEGSASAHVVCAYRRAHELCGKEGDPRQRLAILRGLFGTYVAQGESQSAGQVADEVLVLAHQTHKPLILAFAYNCLGIAAYMRGALPAARTYLEQAVYHSSSPMHTVVHVPRLSYLALTLFWLGYNEQADRAMQDAYLLIHESAERAAGQKQIDPYFKGFTLCHLSSLCLLRGEVQGTADWAARALAVVVDQDLAMWKTYAQTLQEWALAVQGQTAQGTARLQQLQQLLASVQSVPRYADNQIPSGMEKSLDATRGLRFIKRTSRLHGWCSWQTSANPQRSVGCRTKTVQSLSLSIIKPLSKSSIGCSCQPCLRT